MAQYDDGSAGGQGQAGKGKETRNNKAVSKSKRFPHDSFR